MREYNLNSRTFERDPTILATNIGDSEVVLLSGDKENFVGLSGSGPRIWELLNSPQTLESLCGKLTDEYDISAAQCEKEVREFLDLLQRNKLLK